jgi:hypothetical protein
VKNDVALIQGMCAEYSRGDNTMVFTRNKLADTVGRERGTGSTITFDSFDGTSNIVGFSGLKKPNMNL